MVPFLLLAAFLASGCSAHGICSANPCPANYVLNDDLGVCTHMVHCTVDGGWGEWSDWEECPANCDGEMSQSRSRVCDSPAPIAGGAACAGESTETRDCVAPVCIIDGRWGDWSDWTECPLDCHNEVTQGRNRTCDSPAPEHGGLDCAGDHVENKVCVDPACDIPCCPDGYVYMADFGACYSFVTELMDWEGARDWCRAQGTELVTIGSATENAAMQNFVRNGDYSDAEGTWIGLNDREDQGDWRWVADNSEAGYLGWEEGEPNWPYIERCAELRKDHDFQWNNLRCSRENFAICKIASDKPSC